LLIFLSLIFNLFKKSFCEFVDLFKGHSCFSYTNTPFFDFIYLILIEKLILEQSHIKEYPTVQEAFVITDKRQELRVYFLNLEREM
jgi:hypothetical protein